MNLASRNRERRIITASQVLCFSCSSMAVNLRRIMPTIRSISFAEIGRVQLCSRSKFTTWAVNSVHAYTSHQQSENWKTSIGNLNRICNSQIVCISSFVKKYCEANKYTIYKIYETIHEHLTCAQN